MHHHGKETGHPPLTRQPFYQASATLITHEVFAVPYHSFGCDFGMNDHSSSELGKASPLIGAQDCREVGEYGEMAIHTAQGYFSTVRDHRIHCLAKFTEVSLPRERGSYLTQFAIWRDAWGGAPGLTHHISWHFLFPLHHAIMTDNPRSTAGKRFWAFTVAAALTRKVHVYVVDLEAQSALQIKDLDRYSMEMARTYGRGSPQRHLRLLMSKEPAALPLSSF